MTWSDVVKFSFPMLFPGRKKSFLHPIAIGESLLNIQIIRIKNTGMAKIQVNGNEQEVEASISLIELIKKNDVAQPEMVSVQINGEFVDRDDYNSTLIKDGDEVDFLYFMGGGSIDWQLNHLPFKQ